MKRSARIPVVAAAALSMLLSTGCNKLRARDQLNKGVQSYKGGKYEEAIDHFQEAAKLDPNLKVAKLYLATAYQQQVVQGLDTPENLRNADQAIKEYQEVLQQDPNNINALKGIASVYFNTKRLPQARQYQEEIIKKDPNDAQAYYTIGVIDWTKAYKPRMEARAKLGLKPEEPLKDKKVCAQLRDENLPDVDNGIQVLQKAIDLKPNYDDAMAYLNLMYREKADLECGNPDARAQDLKTADNWVEKAMEVKKVRAEQQANQPGGIVEETPKQGK